VVMYVRLRTVAEDSVATGKRRGSWDEKLQDKEAASCAGDEDPVSASVPWQAQSRARFALYAGAW
jgi:hypothetical protein